MSKEYFEALETIRNKFIDLFHEDVPDFDTLEDALQRLESIDNANPSEALKILETLANDGLLNKEIGTISYNQIWLKNQIEILQQALLKTQKEHNSVNLLMQELDCKDFAELRKYARCGYEKLNKKDLHLERVENSNV